MAPNWRGRNFSSAGCRRWKFDLLKVAASTGRGTLAENVTFGLAVSLGRWRKGRGGEGERRGSGEEGKEMARDSDGKGVEDRGTEDEFRRF